MGKRQGMWTGWGGVGGEDLDGDEGGPMTPPQLDTLLGQLRPPPTP